MSPVWTHTGTSWTAPGRTALPAPASSSDGFVLGETEPTWANSGCRIPTANLTRNETGELATTSDGQLIERTHLPVGRIIVRHNNVTIRDCVVQIGPWATKTQTIGRNFGIYVAPGVTGARLEHVTIDPVNAGMDGSADDAGVYGVQLGEGLVWRCAIRKVTDAVSHEGTGTVNVCGSFLRTRWLASDPYAQGGGQTHNDGVQLSGGVGHRIVGCSIMSCDSDGVTPKSSAGLGVALTPYRGLMDDVTIAKNWFFACESQISAWPRYNEGGPAVTNMSVYGNRHGGTCNQTAIVTDASFATARRWENGVAAAGGLTDTYGSLTEGRAVKTNVWRNNQGSGVPA